MTDALNDARRALESARLLLDSGDRAGAANRSYYAIFYAARTVLQRVAGIDPNTVKTHLGVRRLFDLHIVKPGLIDHALARRFAEVESTRISGDYEARPLDEAEVGAALTDARAFVAACEEIVSRPKS